MRIPGSSRTENIFIQLLREQAKHVDEATAALLRFVTEQDMEEAAAFVARCEAEGDELRRMLIDELHKTFITPFDREDIYQLSLCLDDVLDYAHTTVEEIQVLNVKPDAHLADMVGRLQEAGQELHLALERLTSNPMVALEHARRAKARENRVERAYRTAVAELFSGPEEPHHIMAMLRVREVYRHVSNAADRVDQAANVIGVVVVKMT